jgi:hypothetical protein
MKKLTILAMIIFVFSQLAIAGETVARKPASSTTFDRTATCSSHYVRTSGNFNLDGVELKTVTEACSLNRAVEEGKEVCESNNFSWLRPDGGKALTFKKSTISATNCKKSEGDFECETHVVVDCK